MGLIARFKDRDAKAAQRQNSCARPITFEEFERMLASIPTPTTGCRRLAALLMGLWLSGFRLEESLVASGMKRRPFISTSYPPPAAADLRRGRKRPPRSNLADHAGLRRVSAADAGSGSTGAAVSHPGLRDQKTDDGEASGPSDLRDRQAGQDRGQQGRR